MDSGASTFKHRNELFCIMNNDKEISSWKYILAFVLIVMAAVLLAFVASPKGSGSYQGPAFDFFWVY